MTRYPRVWAALLRMSWQCARGLTVLMFALQAVTVVSVVGTALALRVVVDAALGHDSAAAVAGALGAAGACMALSVVDGLTQSTAYRLVDQVAHGALDARIARNIAAIDGIEHLEHSAYLDRITVLRHSAWGLLAGLWSAVSVAFSTVQLAVSLALLGTVSPWLLSVIAFSAVPLWCDRRARAVVNRAETATAEDIRLQRRLFELATSAAPGRELRVTGAAAEVVQRQVRAWDTAVRGRTRARVRAALRRTAGWAVFVLGFAGTLAFTVVYRSAHGGTSPGDIVLAITVSTTLQKALGNSVRQAAGTLDSGRLMEPYLWLEEYAAAQRLRSRGHLPPPRRLTDGIVLEGVGHTYPGSRHPALTGIDLRIPAGSVVALVGEYGSGKTTLVKLLSKFYRPGEGRITVDGIPLEQLHTAQWRARTSATYQDFGRYAHTTLAESIGVGDLAHRDDPASIARAVRTADAGTVVAALPQGLATELDPLAGGVGLSEGQWQKTALARASMRLDPLLFVLDEPTASLDAPSEKAVYERYVAHARTLARRSGAITVVVSHRFSTVGAADLILVFDKGCLVERGTHDELMAARGTYRTLYSLQANGYRTARPGPALPVVRAGETTAPRPRRTGNYQKENR